MYNDLPGNGNNTIANLYLDLAASAPFRGLNIAFTDASTDAEFATAFVNQVFFGAVVSVNNTHAAIAYVTGLLNSGMHRSLAMQTALDLLFNASPADAAYGDAQKTFVNKIAVATDYTTTRSGGATSVVELQAVLVGITSFPPDLTPGPISLDPPPGRQIALTTGVDRILGLGGKDTITADNTGAEKQLNPTDTIEVGRGSTLGVYLAPTDTATGAPSILTGVETFYINGGVIAALTAPVSTKTLSIDAPVGLVAAPVYTLSGQAVILANSNNQTAVTFQFASATDTSENITLNTVIAAPANAAWISTIDIAGIKVTTLNLTTTGADSTIALTNTGAAVATLNLAGDKNLSLMADAAISGALTAVNASNATGNMSVNVKAAATAAGFKFQGGSGNDTLTLANDEFTTLTAGRQLAGGAGSGDKIGLFDTALTAAETAKLNAATGFEVLGLNADITLDASTLASIKEFSIDTAGLRFTINSMAPGSQTTVTQATTALTLGTGVGVTDTRLVVGSPASTGLAIANLTTAGVSNVAIASNGTAANAIINPIANSDNSVLTVTGAADFSFRLANGTTVGSRIDGAAFTGKLMATGSNLIGSGDIIIGGSGADTLDGAKGADTLTGGAGADIFSFNGATSANGARLSVS